MFLEVPTYIAVRHNKKEEERSNAVKIGFGETRSLICKYLYWVVEMCNFQKFG